MSAESDPKSLEKRVVEAFNQSNSNFADHWSFPSADIKHLKELADLVKKEPDFTLRLFFACGLEGYYSPLWSGMTKDCGDVLYRLSDFIPRQQRETMPIYPSPEGSIVNEDGGVWDSLEDWRMQWEKQNESIPFFQTEIEQSGLKQLCEGQL